MASASQSPTPKNTILSFDGGGVRGLSALLILQRLMRRIYVHEVQRSRTVAARTGLPPPTIAPEGEALPRDYFELICGTSTGGLIAISKPCGLNLLLQADTEMAYEVLGRLDMTVDECITEYLDLSASVFGKRNRLFSRYLFDARRLRKAVNSVVERRLGSPKDSTSNAEHEMHRHDAEEATKVFVVTLVAKDINGRPRLLRSYSSGPDHAAAKCSITDAAWATAAAPLVEFVDGGLGYNNPAELARDELVRHRVMVGQPQGVIAGLSDKKSISSHGWSLRILYILRLARALAHLATSTATVHANLASQLPEGRYFRFNVDLDLSHIRLDRYELLDDVYIATNRYLDGVDARRSLDRCAQAVFEERWRSQPLDFGAFLVPHDKGSIPKSHWNRELHRRPWYLETVTASVPYPPDVEHTADSLVDVKPIGNHVVCARNPLNVSLRLFDHNVPPGEYAVIWILCFFGELPGKQRPSQSDDECPKHATGSEPPDYDDLDGAGLYAHPDLFLIAGSPREDIDFQYHKIKTGQADPATLADLGLFRGGAVKHSVSERDWQIERGRGWTEIHAKSRTLKLTQPGAVGFYISQPAQNYIAGWCFGGVRLVPIVEGSTSDGRAEGHQTTHSFGSGSVLRHPMSRSRPNSPVPMRPSHSRPRARSVGPATRPPSPTDPASARADADEAQSIPAFKFGQIDSIISSEVPLTTAPTGLSPPQQLRSASRRSTSPFVQLPMHDAGRSGE